MNLFIDKPYSHDNVLGIFELLLKSLNLDISYLENLNCLNSNSESPVSFSSNKSYFQTLSQLQLSKHIDFILPILKSTKDPKSNTLKCLEGDLNYKIVKLDYLSFEDFIQFMCMIKSCISVHNLYFSLEDVLFFKTENKQNIIYPDYTNDKIFSYNFLNNKFYISFNNDINFMYNYIVNPKKVETKTLYIYAIFLAALTDYNSVKLIIDYLGSDFNEFIVQLIRKSKMNYFDYNITIFLESVQNLVLSEFPSFEEVFELIYNTYIIKEKKYILNFQNINFTYLNPSYQTKSTVLETLVVQKKRFNYSKELSDFDSKLLNKYIQEFKSLPNDIFSIESYMKSFDFYKFPIYNKIYPIFSVLDKDSIQILITKHRYLKNFNIFIQAILTTNISIWKFENFSVERTLINYYKLNKYLYKILNIIYYNYTLSLNKDDFVSTFYNISKIDFDLSNYIPFQWIGDSFNLSLNNLNIGKKLDENNLHYVPTSTLLQIYTLTNKVKSDYKSKIVNLANKIIFHNKNKEYNTKLIDNVLTKFKNDFDIYSELKKLKQRVYPNQTASKDDFDRGQLRINDLNKLNFFSHLPKTPNNEFKYLDYGGGLGDLTAKFANYLKLKKENVFSCDVKNWFAKSHLSEKYKEYITYRYVKSSYLPFKDDTFDFITIFQTLHHVKVDLNILIYEVYRILKTDGILLIREHNCENNADKMLIDIEHSLYDIVVDEGSISSIHNFNEVYFSKYSLDLLLSQGFYKLDIEYLQDKGPTKYFYTAWTKKSSFTFTNSSKLAFSKTSTENINNIINYNSFSTQIDPETTSKSESTIDFKLPDYIPPQREEIVKSDFIEPNEIIFDQAQPFFPSSTLVFPNYRFTDVSLFSTANVEQSEYTAEIISLYFNSTKDLIITDTSSCIGGNTWTFMKYFKYVHAVELSKLHYDILVNNINEMIVNKFIPSKNVSFYNNNYLEIATTINQDILYMDPPWGGVDYKDQPKVGYSINGTFYDLSQIISNILSVNNSIQLIALRVPSEYTLNKLNLFNHIIEYPLKTKLKKLYKIIILSKNLPVKKLDEKIFKPIGYKYFKYHLLDSGKRKQSSFDEE